MKIKMGFASQFCGGVHEEEIDVPDDCSKETLYDLFEQTLGIEFNDECYIINADTKEVV